MSRNIDLSKPLKELDIEDLRYASDRGLLKPEDNEKVVAYLAAHDAEERGDEERPYEKMTVPVLTQYAEDEGIDLEGATLKDDIIAAIRAAEAGG